MSLPRYTSDRLLLSVRVFIVRIGCHPSMTRPMIQILFEDDDMIFVDKPAGIVVQRGYDKDEPVLIDQVADYLRYVPFLMQRLDRGTSGVIFFTKRTEVNANLTRQFERKQIRKEYVALLDGSLRTEVVVDAPLARIGPISFGVRAGGKISVTRLRPVRTSSAASFVEIGLETGRTHQIRVHCAAIGHPLVGDWLYGKRSELRPMLHAKALSLRHPRSGETLRIESPLPEDFMEAARSCGVLA